jgi:N-formylglutamate deformylase
MELFKLQLPTVESLPIGANLPHSGMFVPDSIAQTMLPEHLAALPHTDWHLEQLYEGLPQFGMTLEQQLTSKALEVGALGAASS